MPPDRFLSTFCFSPPTKPKPTVRDKSPDLDYYASMYPEFFDLPVAPKVPPETDKEWSEGDFTIVSSDGIHFQVPSYYLYAARCVGEGSPFPPSCLPHPH